MHYVIYMICGLISSFKNVISEFNRIFFIRSRQCSDESVKPYC